MGPTRQPAVKAGVNSRRGDMLGRSRGGALGALGGAVLGHGLCGLSEDSTKSCTGSLLLGALLGAAVVAIPGALIGGQFSKEPAEPDPSD